MLKPKNSNNFMLVVFLVGLALSLIIGIIFGIASIINPDFNFTIPPWLAISLSQILVFGVPSVIYIFIKRKDIRNILPMTSLGWKNILMLVGMTLLIIPAIALLNIISQLIFPNVIAETIEGISNQSGFIISLILVAVFPSIFEEVAFRGIGFAGYRHIPISKAAAINGLIFGIIHMNMNQFVYAFVIGMLFCYFVYYTKSIWAAILSHFTFNAFFMTLQYIIPSSIGQEAIEAETLTPFEIVSSIIFIGFIVLVATTAFLIVFNYFKKHNKTRLPSIGADSSLHEKELGESISNRPVIFTWSLIVVVVLFIFLMLLPIIENLIGFSIESGVLL